MIARLMMPDKSGKPVAHTLSLHNHGGTTGELKLVMATSTESFPEWLFFFLRDHGAYIETSDPALVRSTLNLPEQEPGIVKISP